MPVTNNSWVAYKWKQFNNVFDMKLEKFHMVFDMVFNAANM